MATPSEKLAESLEVLKELQDQGVVAIRSRDLSRTHRERLTKNGFLQEVIKGWYIPTRPDDAAGESTSWYASFWDFCASYLETRFGTDWCLSAEQSLALHTGNMTVPKQLLVRTRKTTNNVTNLPFDTSILDIRAEIPDKADIVINQGLRLFSLPAALVACAPASYRQNPTDLRAALAMVSDASDLLEHLLEGGHSTIAGRLVGAFRNIGRADLADAIATTMEAAGYKIRETDPFETASPMIFTKRENSPYVSRIQLLWQRMREDVLLEFPAAPGMATDKTAYLRQIDDLYTSDAYHSLSIEGYRVSPDLIERVKSGAWNPEADDGDNDHRNTMAARGYWQAFQAVKQSIEKILDGNNPGSMIRSDHPAWYRELFAPSVTAGTLRAGDLAGYRNGPVYIRRSMHVPPNREAVRGLMPAFFDLLEEETEASVRAVLGHFIFVYIHPYIDGNGRIGRFLMNAMMASGGYPWTIIPVEKRTSYMAALESASVHQDITPFAKFLANLTVPN
ncbi:MAG: cell filamentation protein Fic [Porticoccus sp.]|jgi:fido (protein-threonine AMPylation protein)|uniref:Fic family protein n=1 Tax=Porticoccus hydrocarbonoclasticus TaxID=1073414 RepID=UPI000C65000E|nr:Fic family protein [Porticoccus hydrocarbonoclasticus]MBG57464.1 cell filamentation protein Fic [Porticoccus sp.]|tara:strand:- start:14766 stop:16286 length:1521 start_codon:yes stop_codon:yes gene_type:complete